VFTAFFVTLLMVPALYAIGVDASNAKKRLVGRVKGLFGRRGEHKDSSPIEHAG
jgi:hypothetical protein